MKINHKTICFAYFYLLIGCQNRSPLKDFYFPLQHLVVPQVYEYNSTDDSTSPPYYLYLSTIKDNDSLKLVINYYDHNFLPNQLIIEKMVKNGMKIQSMELFFQDSLHSKTSVIIKGKDVFPFTSKDSNVIYLYNIAWKEPTGDSISLIRNKRYLKDSTYTYNGEQKDAVIFEIKEEINISNQGTITVHNKSYEVYAKGIGLVESKKIIYNGNKTRTYKLKEIYPMETFERKFHTQINKQ